MKIGSNQYSSEDDFLSKNLPTDHNEQDLKYLKARYKWMMNEVDYSEVSKHYPGSTFERKLTTKEI